MLVLFKPRETNLRKIKEHLDDYYHIIYEKNRELLQLEEDLLRLESLFSKRLNEYVVAVGKENIPEEFFDYVIEE